MHQQCSADLPIQKAQEEAGAPQGRAKVRQPWGAVGTDAGQADGQAEGGPSPRLGGRLTGHGAQALGAGRRSKIRSSFSFNALLSALNSALKSFRSCRCLASLAAISSSSGLYRGTQRRRWEPWHLTRPPLPPLPDNTPGPNEVPFDPTLPSIRLVQQWIRRQQTLVVVLHQGQRLQGQLLWQDPMVLALQLHEGQEPVLVQRRSVALIHPAEVSPETVP